MTEKDAIDIATTKIGVVGAGSWGTALANVLAEKGFAVDLWVYEPEVCHQIQTFHENQVFLPGCMLSDNIHPSNDLEKVVSEKNIVLIVVPSHLMRDMAAQLSLFLSRFYHLLSLVICIFCLYI